MEWHKSGTKHRRHFELILILLLTIISTPTYADWTLYTGYNKFTPIGAGVWDQPCLKADIDSSTSSVGFEYSQGEKLGWSLGFVNFGKVTGSGYFVDDEDYDRDSETITYPCKMCANRDYKYVASFFQETRLVYLTADIHYEVLGADTFLKAGFAGWYAKFEADIYRHSDNVDKRYTFSEYDYSPYLESGLKYGNTSVSVYYVPRLRGPESAWDGVIGVKVGVSF
jgi:hypothetical protein